MKIAVITWNFNKKGGIERGVVELSKVWAKEHDVHIFASKDDRLAIEKIYFHNVPIIKNIFILKVLTFFIFSYLVFKKVSRKVSFDIIHLHNPSLIRPDVYTVHSVHKDGLIAQEKYISKFRKYFNRIIQVYPLIVWLSQYNIKQKGVNVVSISKNTEKEVMRITKYHNKLKIIYHGVNEKEFLIIKDKMKITYLKEKIKIQPDDLVLLFVANEFQRKGLDTLLNSLKGLENEKWHLIVIGDSENKLCNLIQIKEISKKNGIYQKCTFLGKRQCVQDYYLISDLYIMPTIYEPFGLVFLESMFMGVTTLIPEIAGAVDLIQNDIPELILKMPITPDVLRERIYYLLHNRKKLIELSQKGKEIAKHYTWKKSAEEYENLFFTIINRDK